MIWILLMPPTRFGSPIVNLNSAGLGLPLASSAVLVVLSMTFLPAYATKRAVVLPAPASMTPPSSWAVRLPQVMSPHVLALLQSTRPPRFMPQTLNRVVPVTLPVSPVTLVDMLVPAFPSAAATAALKV